MAWGSGEVSPVTCRKMKVHPLPNPLAHITYIPAMTSSGEINHCQATSTFTSLEAFRVLSALRLHDQKPEH